MEKIQEELCELLLSSRSCMALTGSGISSESGIPTFRGVQGLWEKYDIMEFAHIDSFTRDPVKVWRMLSELDRTMCEARPNEAHQALADLERLGVLELVVTQNVDNLHQDAGSREVVEFHGNAKRFSCLDCRRPQKRPELDPQNLPPRCECGGLVKPDVIFFGEPIPWAANVKAFEAAQKCDLILVVGTSAVVAPAGDIPVTAKQNGAKVVEINIERTHLSTWITDLFIEGSASQALPPVVDMIQTKRIDTI